MLSLIRNTPRRKNWLEPKSLLNWKVLSRNVTPICGPPKFPMSWAQKILYGGGTIFIMMIIPIWGVLSVPSWSIKHQNRGKAPKAEAE